jgi:curved DNA-binding protein CbpA
MKDLYKVLGLLPEAEAEVIKASYKVLAQKYHPDKHPDKKALFTQIMTDLNEAHAVLCNAKRRKDYDAAWKKFQDKQAGVQPQSAGAASANPTPAPPAAKKPAKHAAVLRHLNSNKVDEVQLVQMYSDLFGVELKIQHGWTNHYSHVVNGKTKSYSFTELKNRIIEKLSES